MNIDPAFKPVQLVDSSNGLHALCANGTIWWFDGISEKWMQLPLISDCVEAPASADPQFKIDDIVRYGRGPTALMQVMLIQPNHGAQGDHYYIGRQCVSGMSAGAYEHDCVAASDEDLITWVCRAKGRGER